MQAITHESISEFDPGTWNALSPPDFPFSDYEFLSALETSGSVGEKTGWIPCYISLEDEKGLAAAMILYEKDDSYGEYIFDWAWANAYHSQGVPYYPKLVSAIPFTPATGSKFLVRAGLNPVSCRKQLLHVAAEHAQARNVSSIHALFIPGEDKDAFSIQEYLLRSSVQFHWRNQGYENFEEFLSDLKVKKRHAIRRERKAVTQMPVNIHFLTGSSLTPDHIQAMSRFYHATVLKKGAYPYLSPSFFLTIAQTMPDRIVLWLAEMDGAWVAGSLHFLKGNALYGRYWGCATPVRHLHFELCYYRAIEFGIHAGLSKIEAGAQGPNKVLKGYNPVITHSAHWIAQPEFREAIGRFVEEESEDLTNGLAVHQDHLAYKPRPGA